MFGSKNIIKNIIGTPRKRGGKNDWDGDKVPNKKDCQPRNTMRQDRTGRHCDKCGHYLSDEEYDKYGSWNYKCKKCGYRYIN